MKHAEFVNKVQSFIGQWDLLLPGDTVLVALSGGADSVALLRVLTEMGYRCAAAHCNFGLRGSESDRDEHFVRNLCATLNVPLHVRHFDVDSYRHTHGVSVEMACRELRYEWFFSLLNNDNYTCLAVAHHNDDNIETMFLNMLRGTGIAGLTGMKPRNGTIVRPLLCVSRNDVLNYLKSLNQDFVTDSTNLTNDYRRNKVRNVLLTDIDATFADGRNRITDTMLHLAEHEELLDELTHMMLRSCHKTGNISDGRITIDITPIASFRQAKLLLHRLLSPYGANMDVCRQLTEAVNRNTTGEKSHFSTSSFHLTTSGKNIIIEPIKDNRKDEFTLDFAHPDNLPVKLEVEVCNSIFNPSRIDGKYTVAFDASIANCKRVVLRHWHHGDRIRPYGMRGTRLLSDIFSDAHLTLQEKEQTLLLDADGEILWVLGLRAAAAFPVTAHSQAHIIMRYKP